MELQTYLTIIRRRIAIIIVGSLLLFGLTLVLLQLIPEKYTSTARIRILTPKSGGANYVDFNIYYATRIMNTYVSLASSPTVLETIKDKLNLTKDPAITVSVIADSELIKITAEENEPTLSAVLANSMAEILVDLSKRSSEESKSASVKAINDKLAQINSELDIARKVYKRLIVPYLENQNKVSALTNQIQADQQVYISLKGIYEQNIQLARPNDVAMAALKDQITELEKSIQKNMDDANQLQQLGAQDSIQIEAARGDITLKEQEYTTLVTQLDQIQALEIIQGSNQLTIEERAVPPKKPSSPNKLLVLLIGAVFSVFLSTLIAFVIDNLDDTFQNVKQVESLVDGAYLGDAYLGGNRIHELLRGLNRKSVIETKHTLKKIHRAIQKQKLKLIALCSTGSGDSDPALASKMAEEYAESGMKVLLIDACLSTFGLYKYYPELRNKPGLSDYLLTDLSTGGVSADEIIHPTRFARLSMIPSGAINILVGKLLSSKKMIGLLQTLIKSYDLVIVTIPPFLIDSDIDELVNHADGIVVSFHQGISKVNNVRFVARQILEIEAPVIGYVVIHSY